MPSTTGWLARLGLGTPQARAWAMYDWANSAMVTLIVTAVFPIFYKSVTAVGLPDTVATYRFGIATTVALAISAVLSPLLGTVADFTAGKKRFLGMFLLLGVLSTGLMFFLQQGMWAGALVLFMLANVGANGSFVFYDALLPHVSPPEEMDRLSTSGYALGYLGGGVLLLLALAMIQAPGLFGLPSGEGLTPAQASLPARISFLLTAVWWVVFSIPLFRRIPEPPALPRPATPAAGGALRTSIRQLGGTLRHLRQYRQAFLLLIAFLIYNDGIGTIIRMATIYGEERHLSRTVMIGAIAAVQFIGIPFSFLFGRLAGRIGAKRSIFIGLLVYVGISVLGYYMTTPLHFIVLACLVGTVQGGTQALSRSLFASMIPSQSSGEFFGFFSVFEKFAGIIGPLFFAVMVRSTGSSQSAILSIILFFVVGGALLALVNVEEGQQQARAAEAQLATHSWG
ncbi:MAG TPA: MFS transporter [Gemmatimonadales bacterium]